MSETVDLSEVPCEQIVVSVYMSVCVYVYMFMFSVCVHLCMYVCMYMRMYVYVYVCFISKVYNFKTLKMYINILL